MANSKPYTSDYNRFNIGDVPLGKAGVLDLVCAILTESETMADQADDNVFHRTIVAQLKPQLATLSQLYELFASYASKDFIELFTRGPFRYKNQLPDKLPLKEVKIQTLANVLIGRLDFAVRKLFRKDDITLWNPNDVEYYRRTSVNLVDFAGEILKFWQKLDETFGASFGLAIKTAVDASKAEAVLRHQEEHKHEKHEKHEKHDKYDKHGKPRKDRKDFDKHDKAVAKEQTVHAPVVKKTQVVVVADGDVSDADKVTAPRPPIVPAAPVPGVWKRTQHPWQSAKVVDVVTEDVKDDAVVEDVKEAAETSETADKDMVADADANDGWQTVGAKKLVNVKIVLGGKEVTIRGRLQADGSVREVTKSKSNAKVKGKHAPKANHVK